MVDAMKQKWIGNKINSYYIGITILYVYIYVYSILYICFGTISQRRNMSAEVVLLIEKYVGTRKPVIL